MRSARLASAGGVMMIPGIFISVYEFFIVKPFYQDFFLEGIGIVLLVVGFALASVGASTNPPGKVSPPVWGAGAGARVNHRGKISPSFCPNCGAQIRSRSLKFCTNCGSSFQT